MMERFWARLIVVMVLAFSHRTESIGVGVNYGLNGDNLPPPGEVVNFLKNIGISRIRIFEPYPEVLGALRGSDIYVSVGTRNEDMANIASSLEAATFWINTHIVPYYDDVNIIWITVGNEAIPGSDAQYILPAIKNLDASLAAVGLRNIVVTTVVAGTVLGSSYPPSEAVFTDNNMVDIVNYLYTEKKPLMINVYPYFALSSDPAHITLDYALFNSKEPAFVDEKVNLAYYNLFDAMFDAFLAAIAKAVGNENHGIQIIVSESGWPNAGGEFATIENARTYNNNLKMHAMSKGTPRYQNSFDVFIFALFNENLKTSEVEQNFGNFYPTMEPVYSLW
ncbi:hypothetical protein AQUCO_04900226v1 [Aquilegia coerulea]|uniref:Glucan endo-1,3-beta-D-glucosidase n=1 Tax=Aquilegia coerulea TaxID=218851 RepID=A0A2G5CKJ3_AQUCA|nr:hypothetical protein AQUCO_04900226v1 [Aquilegia coerulea]